MNEKVAVVVGAGGALGGALVREFSTAGYTVVGLRRAVTIVAGEIRYVGCDLQDAAATSAAVTRIAAEFGAVDALICNSAHLTIAPFQELTMKDFDIAWRASMGAAIASVQAVVPGMLRRGHGAIVFSGATASSRGGARFAAFAAAKFALRGLAQSLAREYQSQGVHVAHVTIDGVLRGSPSAARFQVSDDRAIDSIDVARTYRWLAEQSLSAWTHELDLRPSAEKF